MDEFSEATLRLLAIANKDNEKALWRIRRLCRALRRLRLELIRTNRDMDVALINSQYLQ